MGKFQSINVKGNLITWIKQFKNFEEFNLLKEKLRKLGKSAKVWIVKKGN